MKKKHRMISISTTLKTKTTTAMMLLMFLLLILPLPMMVQGGWWSSFVKGIKQGYRTVRKDLDKVWNPDPSGSRLLCGQLSLSQGEDGYHAAHYARMWFAHLGALDSRYKPQGYKPQGLYNLEGEGEEGEQPSSSNIHQLAQDWNELLSKFECDLPLEATLVVADDTVSKDDGSGGGGNKDKKPKMQSIVDRLVTEADDTFLSKLSNKINNNNNVNGGGGDEGNVNNLLNSTWLGWPLAYLQHFSSNSNSDGQEKGVCPELEHYLTTEGIDPSELADIGYPNYDLGAVARALRSIKEKSKDSSRRKKRRKRRQVGQEVKSLKELQMENILLMMSLLCPLKADYHLSVAYLKQQVEHFLTYAQTTMVTRWRKETIQANLLAALERSEHFKSEATEGERECLFIHLLAHVLGYSRNAVNSDLSMPAVGVSSTGFGAVNSGGLINVGRNVLFFATFPLVRKPNKGFEVASFDVVVDQFVRKELDYLRRYHSRELKLASPRENNRFLEVARYGPISTATALPLEEPQYRPLHRWAELMVTIVPVMMLIAEDVQLDQYGHPVVRSDDDEMHDPDTYIHHGGGCESLFQLLPPSALSLATQNPSENSSSMVEMAPEDSRSRSLSCCLRVLCSGYADQLNKHPKRTVGGTILGLGVLGGGVYGAFSWIGEGKNRSLFPSQDLTRSPNDPYYNGGQNGKQTDNYNGAASGAGGLLFYGFLCGVVLVLLVLGVGYFIIVPYCKKGRFSWFSIGGGQGERTTKHRTKRTHQRSRSNINKYDKYGQYYEYYEQSSKNNDKYTRRSRRGRGRTTHNSSPPSSSASTLIMMIDDKSSTTSTSPKDKTAKTKTFKNVPAGGRQQQYSSGTRAVKERLWQWYQAGLKDKATNKPQLQALQANNNKVSKSKTTVVATAAAATAPKEVTKKVTKEVSKRNLKEKEHGSILSLLQLSNSPIAIDGAAATNNKTTETAKPKYAF